jgi:hypothetical protein
MRQVVSQSKGDAGVMKTNVSFLFLSPAILTDGDLRLRGVPDLCGC